MSSESGRSPRRVDAALLLFVLVLIIIVLGRVVVSISRRYAE